MGLGSAIRAIESTQLVKAAIPAAGVGAATAIYAANATGPKADIASTLTTPGIHGMLANAVPALAVGILAQVLPGEQHALSIGLGVLGGIAGGAALGKLADRTLINRQWYDDARRQTAATVGQAQDFYRAHGITDPAANGPVRVTIDRTMRNATYQPDGRIVIGRYPDGASFARSPDILLHEYGHRVISASVQLAPNGEAGAVNEGLADALAAAIDTSNWTIGEGGGKPLRNLADPHALTYNIGAGPRAYPAHRSEQVTTSVDRGGVHINATIVGHASYLTAAAIGRERMADVYLHALRSGKIEPTETFAQLADDAVTSARELYGAGSSEARGVAAAWHQVGY